MDDADGDISPFLNIAQHLTAIGFSAPSIHFADPEVGLILMEDLGDGLLARIVADDPAQEMPLYLATADFLADLHQAPCPEGLETYSPSHMADLIAPVAEYYAPASGVAVSYESWLRLRLATEAALVDSDISPRVLTLRDFHAENLLWLPKRKGPARLGLLDFQDAVAGHPAYDLASLVADARRDVSPAVREATITRYLEHTGIDEARFRHAIAAQGAQRNLRILGVFTRLCTRLGKPAYVSLIPRVWDLLQTNLAHPALEPLREAVDELLPAPTDARLDRIRSAAA